MKFPRPRRKKLKLTGNKEKRVGKMYQMALRVIKRSEGITIFAFRKDGTIVAIVNQDEEARIRDLLTLEGWDVE